jgi:hypothetical protein
MERYTKIGLNGSIPLAWFVRLGVTSYTHCTRLVYGETFIVPWYMYIENSTSNNTKPINVMSSHAPLPL